MSHLVNQDALVVMTLRIHKLDFPLNEFVEDLVYYHGLTALHNLDRFLFDRNLKLNFRNTTIFMLCRMAPKDLNIHKETTR